MDSVCSTLGIDRVDMSGKTMLIEEVHGSNANFLVNSVLWNALKKVRGVCLVLFHDTFGHYHNVGMRIGHNLAQLRDEGRVTVVEPLKSLASNINDLCEGASDITSTFLTSNNPDKPLGKDSCADLVRKLIDAIKEQYHMATKCNDSVIVIVDDLSHVFDLGLSLRDSMYFVRYLRSLTAERPTSELCLFVHTYHADPENCYPNMVANGLKYMADLYVTVEPLRSGHSSDASGKMNIHWKVDDVRKKYHWPETLVYLFKLYDWHVRIYAPGAMVT